MKICHVINSLNRGGAESHLLDLINAQLNDGMDVHVTVIGEDSTESYSIESELLKSGINITRLNGPRMFNIFYIFLCIQNSKMKNLILFIHINLVAIIWFTEQKNIYQKKLNGL